MKRPIRVGLDFDGVVAYSPLRLLRRPIAMAKQNLFGIDETHFWIPQTSFQQWAWSFAFASSFFPAKGTSLLRQLSGQKKIEAHLVTGRFSFMHEYLAQWLTRRNLRGVFTTVSLNRRDEQPHLFKERVIRAKKFDYFIEDNLDIVRYLDGRTKTNIIWIYNILDHFTPYPHKFPYLEKALTTIVR